MMRTLGLLHVNLNVSDLERSIAFYRGVFGVDVVRQSDEVIDREGVAVRVRQTVLTTPTLGELLALTQGEGFPVGAGGLNHLGFLFSSNRDVELAIDAMIRCGGSIIRRGDGTATVYTKCLRMFAIPTVTLSSSPRRRSCANSC